MTLAEKRDRLLGLMRSYGSCAVAFSGGVDSAVVAKAARLALGEKAVAITGVSASLAEGELEQARNLARLIGIRHEVLKTQEFDDPNYTANPANRCYFCKTELYDQMQPLAARLGLAVIVNGANLDDAGDWRPGMKAAGEHDVRSPLAECGFTKDDVRAMAAEWELPVWEKPASPCLSSRVAYGEVVTPERLMMIDRAEQLLRSLDLQEVRARYHRGDLVRLEVPSEAIQRLAAPEIRERLTVELKRIGFKYVTLDLEGFRSGSQNAVLGSETARLLPILGGSAPS